jgi:hypothetical protein
MDSSIKFLTTVYISFSVAQHDVTHHPAYQPELLSSRTVSSSVIMKEPLVPAGYEAVCATQPLRTWLLIKNSL